MEKDENGKEEQIKAQMGKIDNMNNMLEGKLVELDDKAY
jgi:hypothetical protein